VLTAIDRLLRWLKDNLTYGEPKVEMMVKASDLKEFNFLEDEIDDLRQYRAVIIDEEVKNEISKRNLFND